MQIQIHVSSPKHLQNTLTNSHTIIRLLSKSSAWAIEAAICSVVLLRMMETHVHSVSKAALKLQAALD